MINSNRLGKRNAFSLTRERRKYRTQHKRRFFEFSFDFSYVLAGRDCPALSLSLYISLSFIHSIILSFFLYTFLSLLFSLSLFISTFFSHLLYLYILFPFLSVSMYSPFLGERERQRQSYNSSKW